VVIAAGGTAGHVKPALAIADALRADGAEVSFITTGCGTATGLVTAGGFAEDILPMRGLERRFSLGNLRTLGLTLAAVPRARRILARRGAQVVIGGGGYLAGPVALAAWSRRTPVVLTEADAHLGLANRLAAPLAHRVCLAYPIPERDEPRFVVTGRPVGADVRGATRASGRAALGIGEDELCVLVAGGSQGARTINWAVAEAYADGPPFTLIHVAGAGQLDDVAAMLDGRTPGDRYRLVGYLDNFHDAVAAADLVVARAGGSVSEFAAIGRAMVLIPYPYATGDHQTSNATWYVDAGAAVLLPDAECTATRLRGIVDALVADLPRREAMALAARGVSRPNAAEEIARQVLDAMRR
jgi:UDP-N-acetylglucosamine--N-acetylmuramyl-(pentapeptide) pyrophosphoryl-undecaprenol N-acetylglucosamine transferase